MRTSLGLTLVGTLVILAPAGAGAQAESACTAAKHKQAGQYAQAVEGCRSKAVKKGLAVDAECLAKAGEKLTRASTRPRTRTTA